jgi:acyl-CoA synthetase (NDP forming)
VCEALCRARGVVLADTLDEFARLTALFCQLRDRPVGGWRLGAMSNAGFECVAMGDWQGEFRLEPFSPPTVRRLRAILERRRLDRVVDVRNPFDMTPMLDDAAWEESIRAIMEDPRIDVGVIGCVPLSGAITTLAAGPDHAEDIRDDRSIVRRMARLREEIPKPWVVVVDAGRPYDPMAGMLMAGGIPVFRHTDTAMRLLEIFCRHRLAVPPIRPPAAAREREPSARRGSRDARSRSAAPPAGAESAHAGRPPRTP